MNAPRLLRPVAGDFTLQVKVLEFPVPDDKTPSGGQHSFASAGLLVWQDEKNFIRLERAAVYGGTPFVWVERFKDGKSVSKQISRGAGNDTGLRVTRKGDKFTFEFDGGGEGKAWEQIHAEEVEMPRTLLAGVAAVNTTVREFSPRLSKLELVQTK